MKKILIVLAVIIAGLTSGLTASAQNANRNGFFMEAGIGGLTGNTPRSAVALDGKNLMAYYASGADFNVYLGGRKRIGSNMAFDFRVGLQAPLSGLTTAPAVKGMPGLRYTSNEIFGNMSIYGFAAVGYALGFSYNNLPDQQLPDDGTKVSFNAFDDELTAANGVAYQLGVGMNLTTHFYAGFIWDAQYMFNQTRLEYKENIHWGMAGLQIGYRF